MKHQRCVRESRKVNANGYTKKSNRSAALVVWRLCSRALVFAEMTQSISNVRRVGRVIGIKPAQISAYKALHAASNLGVRDLLTKYHMHNFSIYIHKLDDGKYYLFGYYEYTGNDYTGDMDKLAAEVAAQTSNGFR